jgi:xylan 1,4-beta-xylosidase
MQTIRNPVLCGFHPDPSFLRVGEDYYIATSTFEWFPGVRIHHSKDLVNWRLLTHALTRKSQIDLTGNPDSGGVWAPDLSYADGRFYLVYTDVKSWTGGCKDTHNYLVTAPAIEGPWSDPVYLNSSGFDPSLFHDADGRKWLVNQIWDHRKGRNPFAGIVLQEFSWQEKKLVGPAKNIFAGTSLGFTEGPHLYRRGGFYYLLTAEGGTGYDHAASLARSKKISGPFETMPGNPLVTSAKDENIPLQKAGHGSLVETQTGEWYLAHLCGRPLPGSRNCNLGRETAIQKCAWTGDCWLRLASGGNQPAVAVPAPGLPAHPFPADSVRDDFDSERLSGHFATLRVPPDDRWLSLTDRPGYLRLRGRESLSSRHSQSLVAQRLQAFQAEAVTCVEFEPDSFQQMAGLICIYDVCNWFYLRISHDETLGKSLRIAQCIKGKYDEPGDSDVSIDGWLRCYLKASFNHAALQFAYSPDGGVWTEIGVRLDAGLLSDEQATPLGFTGTFIGICAQDLAGTMKSADFDFFEYNESPVLPNISPSD